MLTNESSYYSKCVWNGKVKFKEPPLRGGGDKWRPMRDTKTC